jgi:hypothetical protein
MPTSPPEPGRPTVTPSAPPGPPSRAETLAHGLVLLALSALLVRSVWVVPYLPTNDGPQHVLSVVMGNHFDDPGAIYPHMLTRLPEFAYRGFSALFAPLERALGWRDGLRCALSVMVLNLAWGFAAMVNALDPRRRAVAALGFPLALCWPLYMGFFAFVTGTGLGLWVLAFVLSRPTLGARSRALVGLGLLAQAVAHVFTASLTGALVAGVLLLRARGARERLRELLRTAAMGAPAAAVQALALTDGAALRTDTPHAVWTPLTERLRELPGVFLPGPTWRATALLAALAAVALGAARQALRGHLRRDEVALALAALTLLAITLAGPRDIPGWQLFSPRFAPFGIACLLALVPLESIRRRGLQRAAAFALALVAAGALGVSSGFHRQLAAGCGDLIAGLSAPVTRRGVSFTAQLSLSCGVRADAPGSEIPYFQPLAQAGALYAVAHGGVTHALQVGVPSAHAFAGRPWPWALVRGGLPWIPSSQWGRRVDDVRAHEAALRSHAQRHDPALRRRVLTSSAAFGMYFESLVLAGARPDDLATLRELGYAIDWHRGAIALAHFEPCAIELVAPGARPAPIERADVGLIGLARPVVVAATPVPVGADGRGRRLPWTPCGRVWVRPVDPAGPRPTGATPSCRGADGSGRLALRVDRGTAVVSCDPATP